MTSFFSFNRVFFSFFTLLFSLFSFTLFADLPDFPVLHQARFRPADTYARAWLYEFYQAETLQQEDLEAFKVTSPSAFNWLWSLHVKGFEAYQTAPLFWVNSSEMKKLAHLPSARNRFSYQELIHTLYEHPLTSQEIFKRLATYAYFETYFEGLAHRLQTKIELKSLLPGLWIQWHHDQLRIVALPALSPWPFLKVGDLIAHLNAEQAKVLIKKDRLIAQHLATLRAHLQLFSQIKGVNELDLNYKSRLQQLQKKGLNPLEIQQTLEQEYSLPQRLQTTTPLFLALPRAGKFSSWISLQALLLQTYHANSGQMIPIKNFTPYSQTDFEALRDTYQQAVQATEKGEKNHELILLKKLEEQLNQAYQSIAGHVYQEAHQKRLTYPSLLQLKVEAYYTHYAWTKFLLILYGMSCLLLILTLYRPSIFLQKSVWLFILAAFSLHTFLLLTRCYILERPPVSNMFETVIYVPWIAVLTSLCIPGFRKQPLFLLGACLTAFCLLAILEWTHLNQSLEQVQAVLDSQFWLTVHVLMVVGSYGLFMLGALLGHFYLISWLIKKPLAHLTPLILQTLYGGTALLITGTILGGVWAAESWGRFWDWDPKESWAFISSCLYLIWIHAYRFHRIAAFGLALGAVTGFLAITFTWYGVNYILGTGLHSYGFGSGGEVGYYFFFAIELLFISLISLLYLFKPTPLLEEKNK